MNIERSSLLVAVVAFVGLVWLAGCAPATITKRCKANYRTGEQACQCRDNASGRFVKCPQILGGE